MSEISDGRSSAIQQLLCVCACVCVFVCVLPHSWCFAADTFGSNNSTPLQCLVSSASETSLNGDALKKVTPRRRRVVIDAMESHRRVVHTSPALTTMKRETFPAVFELILVREMKNLLASLDCVAV